MCYFDNFDMYAGNKRYYLIMAYLDNIWMEHIINDI